MVLLNQLLHLIDGKNFESLPNEHRKDSRELIIGLISPFCFSQLFEACLHILTIGRLKNFLSEYISMRKIQF